jgi:predicted DNA-binding ribbon-helix-helix protein
MKTQITIETTRTTIDIRTSTYWKYKRLAVRDKTTAKKLIETIIENAVNKPKKATEEQQ